MYFILIVLTLKQQFVGMNSEEFDNISRYLSLNVYPIHSLESKNNGHVKKYSRVRAERFQIGENGKIFKVIFNKYICRNIFITNNKLGVYTAWPYVFVQTQISTHISSHLSA